MTGLTIDLTKRYNPEQPRIPKGSRGGGRWTENPVGQAIAQAYANIIHMLGEKPGAWTHLHEIRQMIPSNFSRQEVDEEIKRLVRGNPEFDLVGEPNRSSLTPERRASGLVIGGQETHIMAMRGDLPKPNVSPRTARWSETPTGQAIAQAISNVRARRQAAGQNVDWLSLTDIRDELSATIDRADVDAELRRLARGDGDLNLAPESNQKTLSLRDRAAALRMGQQDNHALSVDPALVDALPAPIADSRGHRLADQLDRMSGDLSGWDAATLAVARAAAVRFVAAADTRLGGAKPRATRRLTAAPRPDLAALADRHAAGVLTPDALAALNLADLRDLAGRLGIPGRSRMRKAELAAAISAPAAGAEDKPPASQDEATRAAIRAARRSIRPPRSVEEVRADARAISGGRDIWGAEARDKDTATRANDAQKPSKRLTRKPPQDSAELLTELRQATSREDGHRMLDGLKADQLRAILTTAGYSAPARASKEKLRASIVETLIGHRLDTDAIMRS